MKKSTLNPLIALVVLGSLVAGCKEELDVNAPYKEITIVYALLNKTETTHYVKINRAFLGEGNAYDYAQIADSNEYRDDQLQAHIEELDGNNNVVWTYPLHDTILDRDLGIFYGPQHKLYYFHGRDNGGQLNQDLSYRLVAQAKGNNITAVTPIVNNFAINSTILSASGKISIATNGAYQPYEIKWTSGADGKRYEVSYTFYYDEVMDNTDTVQKNFTSFIGSRVATGNSSSEQLSVTIGGEQFYQTVASNVHPDPHVLKRLFRGVDLLWAVAGSDLHTYLQLQNPISGIVEDRPDYSNVTNGYGLFSSRFFDSVSTHNNGGLKQLNDPSKTELQEGQYTGGLLFCFPGGSPPFGCN